MIVPLGDSPNPPGIPVVTYGLLAVNLAVYVLITLPLSASPPDLSDPLLGEYVRLVGSNVPHRLPVREILSRMSAYDLFVYRHGFRPIDPNLFDLVSSIFLHAGFVHLAGNMLFLWIYGDNVEHRLGRGGYLAAYLGTGSAATVFHGIFEAGSPLPLIGASGAVSGLLGFYFLWFPRNQVRLLLLFPFLLVVTVSARVLLGLYIIVDNVFPFLVTRGTGASGVAYGAHIGGFLGGLAIAWAMDRREVVRRPREYRGMRTESMTGGPVATVLSRAIGHGRFADAAEAYFSLPPESTRRVLTPEDSLALADWLSRNGHESAALTIYRRTLRDCPRGPAAAEAHFGAGMIQLQVLGQATAAYQHFLDALDFDPAPETAARVRSALAAIEARQRLRIGKSLDRRSGK